MGQDDVLGAEATIGSVVGCAGTIAMAFLLVVRGLGALSVGIFSVLTGLVVGGTGASSESAACAEIATKRVAGVRAVANDIGVRLPAIDRRPDPDIARDALGALKAELPISHDRIKVLVKDGWITLEPG
jgi:hypothetical protein